MHGNVFLKFDWLADTNVMVHGLPNWVCLERLKTAVPLLEEPSVSFYPVAYMYECDMVMIDPLEVWGSDIPFFAT